MKFFDVLSHKLSDAFVSLAGHISSHPKYTIILSVLSSVLLGLGIIRIDMITDFDFMFSPLNSRAYDEQRITNQLFPMNKSYNFDILRLSERGRGASIIVTSNDGKTVLRKSVFMEVLALNEMVVGSLEVKWKGRTYTYSDICAKNNGNCYKNHVLSYFDRISQIEANETGIRYPFEIDWYGMSLNLTGADFGGVKTDITKIIIEAKAIRLLYVLDDSDEEINDIGLIWEEEFRNQLSKYTSNIVTASYFTSSDFDILSWKFLHRGLLYGIIGVSIIVTFCVASLMTSDWVTSKPTLAIAGCASAQLAMLSSTGLLCAFGVSLTNINNVLFFLISGIAVDDMFVLVAAWRTTDPKDNVAGRLSSVYSCAAMPVTMTSLTNFIGFLVGSTVSVPAVRIFCVHGALAIAFDLIYQLTFFGGCMVLDGYREEKKLHPLTFQPVMLREEAGSRSLWYQILFTRKSEINETSPSTWFGDKLGYWISTKWVGTLILIVFTLYIAGATWGCISLKSGLEFKDLFFYDSHGYPFATYIKRYFTEFTYPVQVSVNATLDYSDRRIQKQVVQSVDRFHRSKYIQRYDFNWLKQYLLISKYNRTYYTSYNLSDPRGFINCMRNEFFQHPFGRVFRDDVKFHEDGKHIVASRFIFINQATSDIKQQKELITQMRSIADSLPFPTTVQSFWWIAGEIAFVIKQLSIQSVGITAAAVLLVFILLSPRPQGIILMIFNILSIEFGTIGYMSLFGITLSPVSVIILILSVGLAVDPCTHIYYAYKRSNGTYQERIQQTIFAAGVPVLQGSFSTMLGVLPLSLMQHYNATAFVVVTCLIVIISLFHAIFLLPIFFGLWDFVPQIFCNIDRRKTKMVEPATPQLVSTISGIEISRF